MKNLTPIPLRPDRAPAAELATRVPREVHESWMAQPAWRRIMDKLLTPPASSDQRISERLARYTADPADD